MTTNTDRLIELERLPAVIEAAGLDDTEIGVVAAGYKADQTRLRAEFASIIADDAAASTEQLARLVRGDITARDYLIGGVLELDTRQGKSRAIAARDKAVEAAGLIALRRVRPLAPAVFADAVARDRALVEEATKLASKVAGIDDDSAAMRATAGARSTWMRLVDILAEREALGAVVGVLRGIGAVPSLTV
jgi:hypothetical protein